MINFENERRLMRTKRLLFGISTIAAAASSVILIMNHYNVLQYIGIPSISKARNGAIEPIGTQNEISQDIPAAPKLSGSEMVSGEQEKNSFHTERWKVLQRAKKGLFSSDADTRERAIHIISDLGGKELTKDLFNLVLKEEEVRVLNPLLGLIGTWGDNTMVPWLTELKYKKYRNNYSNDVSMYVQINETIERIRARTKR